VFRGQEEEPWFVGGELGFSFERGDEPAEKTPDLGGKVEAPGRAGVVEITEKSGDP